MVLLVLAQIDPVDLRATLVKRLEIRWLCLGHLLQDYQELIAVIAACSECLSLFDLNPFQKLLLERVLVSPLLRGIRWGQ